ncbi:MAG: globin domain-containing protein [Acidobacteriota bacterium]|jgi:methyl-accepting chemotaxis protein
MTREQIELVRKSFDLLRPIPRGAGRDFYETLFALDPSLKSLFSSDVENQGAMFVVALGLALKGLDKEDETVDESLRELGRRHVLYGARDVHFDTFREALLCMFAQRLGPDFTPAMAEAWRAAFDRISAVMKAAAAEARE